MELTNRLKAWLIENAGIKATATDEEFRTAAATALVGQKLTMAQYGELTKSKEDESANAVLDALKAIASGQTAILEKMNSQKTEEKAVEKKEEKKTEVETPAVKHNPSELEKMFTRMSGYDVSADGKSFDIKVKEAADRYKTTKTALTYPETDKNGRKHLLAGLAVKDFGDGGYDTGRVLDTPSERDRAIAGAWGKYALQKSIMGNGRMALQSLQQHDRELIGYALDHEKWGGSLTNTDYSTINNRVLTDGEKANLIDDVTSGGLEAAPIVFDDMVIEAPLLYGELFPMVNKVSLDRGRRIEGVSIGRVTGAWGGVDDTAITPFDATSYVAAFDTTIYRWQGAMKVGLDFLSDTPINFAATIARQFGERLLEDLDDVIATGDGTTQPEGIFTKSGATSVTWSSTTSIGNYESLWFGLPKAELRAPYNRTAVFVGNQTSYQRARAIPVGSSDARRLMGSQMTVGGITGYPDYRFMDIPYKINASIANTKVAATILARYRMYVRKGFTMQVSTEGATLRLANEMLVTCMARYGGAQERGATIVKTTDAPA